MVGRGLGVVLGYVGGQRGTLGAIDGDLRPGLRMPPRRRPRTPELDGGLAVRLVLGEGLAGDAHNR